MIVCSLLEFQVAEALTFIYVGRYLRWAALEIARGALTIVKSWPKRGRFILIAAKIERTAVS